MTADLLDLGVATQPGGEERLRVAGQAAKQAWPATPGDPFGKQRGMEAADDDD